MGVLRPGMAAVNPRRHGRIQLFIIKFLMIKFHYRKKKNRLVVNINYFCRYINIINGNYCVMSIILGYHGCHRDIVESVVRGKTHLKPSNNSYDWLGSGIYFWEDDPSRALDWAKNRYGDNFFVVGAAIDLADCLDLVRQKDRDLIGVAFQTLKTQYEIDGEPLPKNTNTRRDPNNDRLMRNLDCAVIHKTRDIKKSTDNGRDFDTIRAPFLEGEELYSGSGFRTKTHIQVAVVNPNCVKGYFIPKLAGFPTL